MSTMGEPAPLSPCIGVCAMNSQTGLCDGCYRTLAEIAAWRSYTAEEKRAVLAQLEERCLRIWDEALCI